MAAAQTWRRLASAVILAAGLGWSTPSPAIVDWLSDFVVSDEQVYQLGLKSFEEIKQQEKIADDRAAQRRVQEIGRRIVQASDSTIPADQWEFVVFDSDQINAFALPGGRVGVYTGLIDIAESDDQLAAVIGHEIAHVTQGHAKERITTGIGTNALVSGASALIGGENPVTQQIADTILGAGAEFGVARPFGRGQESEADTVGLRYMAEAGYNPHAAVEFWQNMTQAKGGAGGLPAWLSTHPADQARINALKQEIKAMGY
ncbi:MAG: M48 family metallopeptidase [Pseudomonadota bacterium]